MKYEDVFQSIPCEPEIVKQKGVEIELHPIHLQLIKQWLDEIVPPIKTKPKPIVRIKQRVKK